MKRKAKSVERTFAWFTFLVGLKFIATGEYAWGAMSLLTTGSYAVTEFYHWYSMRRLRAYAVKVARAHVEKIEREQQR